MLHDVDRDAVRRSETAGTRGPGVQCGLGRGGGGRRRVTNLIIIIIITIIIIINCITNLQRDAARQETVDFQLSNDDIWVLRES